MYSVTPMQKSIPVMLTLSRWGMPKGETILMSNSYPKLRF